VFIVDESEPVALPDREAGSGVSGRAASTGGFRPRKRCNILKYNYTIFNVFAQLILAGQFALAARPETLLRHPRGGGAKAKPIVAMPIHQTFSYRVPEDLREAVVPGLRVLVPFGNRRVTAYVLGAGEPLPDKAIKDVLDILDDVPLFPESMIDFFRWVADYYLHPIGEVIRCALPGGLTTGDRATVSVTASGRRALAEGGLPAAETRLLQCLLKTDLPRKDPRLTRALVRRFAGRGWIRIEQRLRGDRTGQRTENFVIAGRPVADGETLSPQRRRIVERVAQEGEIPMRMLQESVRTTAATIRSVARQGYIAVVKKPVYRDPFGDSVRPDRPLQLSADQKAVVETVVAAFGNGFRTFLLAGVTGSGKTEVYLHLAAEAVHRGLPALILIPEIALISQMERRFRARFGDRVAVLHSGLTSGQRYDQWRRIIEGEVSIAIGARSAIFSPFPRLGLIVVDEEHDTSYKQEGSLRYNARDLAVVRAKIDGAVALLGSATPSVQSSYNAVREKFIELSLDHRVERRPLPEITVVDLRKSRDMRGSGKYFSPELHRAMAETLERGEQVLLFLNRRGFASFPVCGACGAAIRCRNCDISLTLHRQANAYRCHYCGFSLSAQSRCLQCDSEKIRHLGLGTEKIEASVQGLFPEARVARMDRDTTPKRGSLVRLLKDLQQGRIDVLVGTQMVTKGHDFPNITLVGVVCADLSMNFPDFRAGERTFQLLAQVAGRAGRGHAPGRVILQTYNPEHFSIKAAQQQDFRAFYREEIVYRQALKYPPFSRIIQVKISGRDAAKTAEVARRMGSFCHRLRSRKPFSNAVEVLGPLEAAVPRIAGRYRWQILLKSSAVALLQRFGRRLLAEQNPLFGRAGVTVALDVDPFFLM